VSPPGNSSSRIARASFDSAERGRKDSVESSVSSASIPLGPASATASSSQTTATTHLARLPETISATFRIGWPARLQADPTPTAANFAIAT
jgi:hypothetical protein